AGRAVDAAHGDAEDWVFILLRVGLFGIARNFDRVVQGYKRRRVGIVGNKGGGEVLVERARPMERAIDGGAAADLFGVDTLYFVGWLVVNPGGSVSGGV